MTMKETSDNQGEGIMYIPASYADQMPSMVKSQLKDLPAGKQEEFLEEYKRKKKSTGMAYLLWFMLAFHYGYFGKWGLQVLFWITFGGLIFWWVIDLFRIPGIISNYNKDVAVEVIRGFK